MRIDNSQASAWHFCPAKYWEQYVQNIQKKPSAESAAGRDFGKRVHELLEDHFRALGNVGGHGPLGRTPCNEAVETEAQEMFAAYVAHYPVEPFEVIDVERTWELALPGGRHTATGKFDGFVRGKADPYQPGGLYLLEHKTEKRGGKANLPESWAARAQVGLYQWAGEQIYGEKVAGIILDVLTRSSPAGRVGPEFRRDTLSRTHQDCELAVANLNWTADQIERCREEWNGEMWPQDRENCCRGGFKCDFYNLHIFGRSEFELQQHYQPTEKYLDL